MFKKEFIMLPEGNVFLWEESGKSHSQNQPNKCYGVQVTMIKGQNTFAQILLKHCALHKCHLIGII